jgi:pyruvate kinase
VERARRTKLVCTLGPATTERVGELVAVEPALDPAQGEREHDAGCKRPQRDDDCKLDHPVNR